MEEKFQQEINYDFACSEKNGAIVLFLAVLLCLAIAAKDSSGEEY